MYTCQQTLLKPLGRSSGCNNFNDKTPQNRAGVRPVATILTANAQKPLGRSSGCNNFNGKTPQNRAGVSFRSTSLAAGWKSLISAKLVRPKLIVLDFFLSSSGGAPPFRLTNDSRRRTMGNVPADVAVRAVSPEAPQNVPLHVSALHSPHFLHFPLFNIFPRSAFDCSRRFALI